MSDIYSSMIELQGKEHDWSIEMNTNKSNILSFAHMAVVLKLVHPNSRYSSLKS